MNQTEILAYIGKTVSVTLQNGFTIRGSLLECSRTGVFLESGGEYVFLNSFEVKSISF